MDQEKVQRGYVFVRAKLGDSGAKIHEDLVTVFGDDVLSYETVCRWKRSFDADKDTIQDEKRSGRPRSLDVDRIIQRELLDHPQYSTRDIASTTGIAKSAVFQRLVELGWRSIHTKWIPHELTESQKMT